MADTQLKGPSDDPILAVLEPAFKVGVACGTAGFVIGGATGILRSSNPFLFASFSGLQWFVLGSTFWGCRTSVLRAWTPHDQTHNPNDLVKATTVAGGITGGVVGLLTRGRRNVLPGILMCSLVGFMGQWMVNRYHAKPNSNNASPEKGFWERMSDKKWSPVKMMSDEEYVALLEKKKLAVDAEISVLEDKIVELRKQQGREQTAATSNPVSTEK